MGAMVANYVQRGESLDYINTGTAVIRTGTVIPLGTRIGVAGCDIPAPGPNGPHLGSVHVVGVYEVEKADKDTVFAIGDEVFYSEAGAVASGTVKIGWAVADAPAGVAEVSVKIG